MNQDATSDRQGPAGPDRISMPYLWLALMICSWTLVVYLAALLYAALT